MLFLLEGQSKSSHHLLKKFQGLFELAFLSLKKFKLKFQLKFLLHFKKLQFLQELQCKKCL